MKMLKRRKQEQQRRERRAREKTEAAAAAQRQREEARATAARAAAALNAKEEAAASALAIAAAAAQAESIAVERAAAAAAAAKQAADDAAQAANAKARAAVEFEEHNRECERAETAAEVAAAQAAAALEISLCDDLSDDASSVYAEDSVLQEQRDLLELPVSEELPVSKEATVSEEAMDFLIAEALQRAQSELEFERHAENISHAVLATALSQLEQEDADALTYQGALRAVTPVNTDGARDADTAFSLEIVGRPIKIHRTHQHTLTQDDDDLAGEAGEPARQTPSRHVRFSDQDDNYNSDLLVSAHAGDCVQQDQSAASAAADTAKEEARGKVPVEQAETSAGVHAKAQDAYVQNAIAGVHDDVAQASVADAFVRMVIAEAQDELAQDAYVRNAIAGVHDDVAQASQLSVHDAAEPVVPTLENGVHARMCASANATAADETLAVVATFERSGPHMDLVLRLGDDTIARLSLSPPQTPRTPVERLFVDQRRFNEQPECLSPAPQFQSQRLYSQDRTYVVHARLAQMPCDEDPASASRKEAKASAALDAYVDAYVRMVIAEAQDKLVQAQAEEVSAVSDAFVRMVIAEARTELVQAMSQSLLPVRRPIPVSPPSSPSKGHGLDVEVTVNLKFNEDFDWLTADEHRKSGWSEWIMGIVCDAVKVSPRRIRMAGLQPGSVCLLLRCLPLSETPGLAVSDCRSAMELGIQILAFASTKDAGTKLPEFLGGTLHSTTEQPLSHGASQVGKAASTIAGPGGGDASAAEQDTLARDEGREEVEPKVGHSSDALSPVADKGVHVDGVLEDGEKEENGTAAHEADVVEARLEHEVEEEKSLADTMLEEAAASSESEQQPVAQRRSAVELCWVEEDTLEVLPTSPREAVLIDKVEGPARPVDIDTAEGAQDESSLSSLSIQGSTIEDVTGTPTPAHSDLQPPPPPVEVIFEDKLGESVGAVETEAERVVDEVDVTRRLFVNPDEPATVVDEVAAEKMRGGRQMIEDNQRAQVDQDGVERAGANARTMLEDEKVAGEDVKKKKRKKRRVNLREPGASSPHIQPKMIAADRERLAILDTQRAVEEQHRRDLQVAAEKERLRDRQDKRVRAQIQQDQTLHVKWVMDRNQWELASAARAKSPHKLAHGVEQHRVTYSLGRYREARHRAVLEASASYEAASPAASRSASPTATPSARVNNMATSTPHPKAFLSAATPHPKAFHSAANGDSPPIARRIAWYEDGDCGEKDDGIVGESEYVHAPLRPSTASNGGRARSPGSAGSRPTSSADMFSEPLDPEEPHVKPRRRRQKPQPVSTSDDLPSCIQLARSPYGSTKPGMDLQRTTATTPPARYAKKVRQSASPSSAHASVHFASPGSPASPGSRMQQLRSLAQSNRERGFETAASGARRPSTAPPKKSFPPQPAPSGGARGVGSSQLPALDSTRQPIDQASADRRRKDLIMGVLSESQLFGPMLVGDTCLGRVKLPIAVLLKDEHGSGAAGGAARSVELPVHNSSGRPLLGLDGHLSTVTISWKDCDECLTVVVERASHLPKVKRFGLCDTQVTVECGLYKFSTDIARCDLNPNFNTVYHFPKPLMLASAASQHLLVSIMHVDIRDLLEDMVQQCLVVAAEPGAQIMQSGQEADRMLVLASGSVGVWCSQEAGAAGAHAGARAGSPPRSPAQTGRGVSPKRRRRGASGKGAGAEAADARQTQKEIGTISLRGTCFGDLAVLTGKRPQYTLVASTEVWLVQVPRAAISSLLQKHSDVAEHMAHAVCQHRENAFWARRASTLDVHGL
jgi:CRP-like cAMP-binding protein